MEEAYPLKSIVQFGEYFVWTLNGLARNIGPGPTTLALLESSRHTDVDERKQGWMLTNLRVCT